MLKIIVPVVIVLLAVISIACGVRHYTVPAAICAYLSVTLILLAVWHLRCVSWKQHEQAVLVCQEDPQRADRPSEDPSCRS